MAHKGKRANHVLQQASPSCTTNYAKRAKLAYRRTHKKEALMGAVWWGLAEWKLKNFYLNLNIFAKKRLCSRGDRNKGQNLEKWLHDYYIVFISIHSNIFCKHFLHSNRDFKTSLHWWKKVNGTKKDTIDLIRQYHHSSDRVG